jgi:MFS transporter, AAHS family, 4-hydroxybenzoate transporter
MSAATAPPIDVQAIINNRALSRVQLLLLVLCFFVVAVDGFDTAAIGFIAPAIRGEWGSTPAQLAPLFGAGLFGLMLGAFTSGPLADRLGRKTILVSAVAFFGAVSLFSAWSASIGTLTVMRFITGLGLGGAMPNAVTLTAEYCPERRRSSLVTLMFCGFTLGSALGGFAAAHLIASHGWRSVLVLGGAMPLALAPVLWIALPESLRFLVMRGDRAPRVEATLRQIAPNIVFPAGARFVGAHKPEGLPVQQLFRRDLVVGTLLLWLTFFMSLLVVYLLSSWLPTLIRSTGASLATAAVVTAMFQVGGTVGAIALGRLMDLFDPHRVLGASYALAGLFIALVGSVAASPWLVALAVFGAGFCVSGSQVGANALSAAFYPTASRATGVSWANAVGRSGSVLGSMVGGVMLGVGWRLPTVFATVAAPAVIAGISMLVMGVYRHRTPVPLAVTGIRAFR